ncbi:DUF1385 domain-containing protein [Paenibacillus yanchengensis]|uniref:DUF1385 domain-containing protein n=1 Tax=Paenibacillus yanchengensis TaxID=2035833 RepID=A0ABW4YK33_9BACL
MSQDSRAVYGGQAVIEGVMFQGKHVNVTAVRRKNNEIVYYHVPRTSKPWVQSLKKIPFLRGVVGLVESSAKGSQHLNFSSEQYAEDEYDDMTEEERAKQKQKDEKEKSGWSAGMVLSVAAIGVLSFVFGKLIFTAAPAAVEQLLFNNMFHPVVHNLIEGLIKLVFLLVYLYFMSMTPIIKRLFQYHGAEHKVISAYEAGEELTVDNVQKYSRLHYRCGSSFIIFTVIVGIILYSMPIFDWGDSIWKRVYIRVLLLPVVLGISYEVLRITNAVRNVPILRYLGYPGLWLQLLTTKEPNNDQVAVSIASFKKMQELDVQLANEAEAVTSNKLQSNYS